MVLLNVGNGVVIIYLVYIYGYMFEVLKIGFLFILFLYFNDINFC